MRKISIPNFKDFKLPRIRHLNRWTILALISYLNILVLIPLLMSKKNDFVRFHSRQGFVLFLFTAVGIFLFYLPVLPLIFTIYVIFCIFVGIINVLTSREKRLPLIGRLVA